VAILGWAGAGAWWLVAPGVGGTNVYIGLAISCISGQGLAGCGWIDYTDVGYNNLAIAGAVLLCIGALFAFFQACALACSCCCAGGRRGATGCSAAMAIVAFALLVAGTACASSFYNYSFSTGLFSDTTWASIASSRPGFGLAIAACIAAGIGIILAFVDACCCSSPPAPKAAALDASTFSGSNPQRV